jgi:neopullulanase
LAKTPGKTKLGWKLLEMIYRFTLFACLSISVCSAQQFDHVEPPFWWVGMEQQNLQILFHNDDVDLSSFEVDLKYPGVQISDVTRVENKHFLFVTLTIDKSAAAGTLPVTFRSGKTSFRYSYSLLERSKDTNRHQGFSSADVIYLIMPDRFANGDTRNDNVKGMAEISDRTNGEGRHGGDLKGIANHLSYLKELGVTSVWLTPVLENNQKRTSYHGYSITDHYHVDARFGGNDAYLEFVNEAHAKGLKVVKDMVMNHIGSEHWLMKDLPEKGWIHGPEFTRTNYQANVASDPHRSKIDSDLLNDGWFDVSMPDLDQTRPLLATYLIQNTLWWIEYAGIDGIRMDTYPYPDKHFMARWAKAVTDQYPSFNIVGEVWLNNSVPATAYWQHGANNSDGYQSNLRTVTDFPLCFTVAQALNEPGGNETGLRRLYILLSQDFVYPNAGNNLIFLDNHDMTRFFLSVGRDLEKFKMGLTFLLTTRGIPEIYYGTELLMDGDGSHHPNVRKDFPGGWEGDPVNAFETGRTPHQKEAFEFIQRLLQWRKNNPAIHTGKLTHFIPYDNVYVYFRTNEKKKVMVIMNGSSTSAEIDLIRYKEAIGTLSVANEVTTGQRIILENGLSIPPKTAWVLELH